MAQLGLDQFLNSLQSGGEYVQTSEFTLNTLKAREKLSQYQLADTGLWLVKLLQAAVVIGSPEVQIKFGKRQVTVQFENSRNYRAGALLQHVLSGEIPSDRALWHLITGLRASATFSSELVRWSCGRERASLDGSGSVVERVQEHPYFLVECSRPSRQRSLKKALTSSVYHLAKETVEEHDAVRSRCWASPIPVFLDGQELDRGYGVVSAGKIEESPWEVLMKHERSRSSKVTAVLAVGGIAAENSERARLPGSPLFDPAVEPILNKPVCKGETFLCYPDSGEGSGAVVVISAGHDSPTCIDYLLDGAMVCREPLENQLPETKVLGITVSQKPTVGVRFLIPVEPKDVDLSQFNVRGFEQRSLLQKCFPCFSGLVEALNMNRNSFWYVPFPRRYAKVLGLVGGGQLALVMAMTKGAAILPISGVAGVVGGLNTAIWRSGVYDGLKKLKELVEDSIWKP